MQDPDGNAVVLQHMKFLIVASDVAPLHVCRHSGSAAMYQYQSSAQQRHLRRQLQAEREKWARVQEMQPDAETPWSPTRDQGHKNTGRSKEVPATKAVQIQQKDRQEGDARVQTRQKCMAEGQS